MAITTESVMKIIFLQWRLVVGAEIQPLSKQNIKVFLQLFHLISISINCSGYNKALWLLHCKHPLSQAEQLLRERGELRSASINWPCMLRV